MHSDDGGLFAGIGKVQTVGVSKIARTTPAVDALRVQLRAKQRLQGVVQLSHELASCVDDQVPIVHAEPGKLQTVTAAAEHDAHVRFSAPRLMQLQMNAGPLLSLEPGADAMPAADGVRNCMDFHIDVHMQDQSPCTTCTHKATPLAMRLRAPLVWGGRLHIDQ